VFFGADAGEILGKLNGGDMDDMLFCFWGTEYLEKFRQMHYPVQPRIKDQICKAKSGQAKRNEAVGRALAKSGHHASSSSS